MKADKNFKMLQSTKRMLASSRFTKEQINIFKKSMIEAQLASQEVVRFKTKTESTGVDL